MKTLIAFAILLTSYLAAARIDVIEYRPLDTRGFGSFKHIDQRSDVNKDIQDFINLLPRSKIEGIVHKWIDADAEVKNDWAYATSDAVQQRILDIEQLPEFLEVRRLLESKHVDVVRFTNQMHDILGIPHMSRGTPKAGTGLRGLLDEVRPTIPMTKIKLLAGRKYIFSSQFRGLVSLARSNDFKVAVKNLGNHQQVVAAYHDAEQNGVDMKAISDFMKSFSYILEEILPYME